MEAADSGGGRRLGQGGDLLLQQGAAADLIRQFAAHRLDACAHGLEPRDAAVHREQILIARGEFRAAPLCLAQLLLIHGELLQQEGAGILHLAAVGAAGQFEEQVHNLLHHVMRDARIGVDILNGEQVAGLAAEAEVAGQLIDGLLAVGAGGDALGQRGAVHQPFEVGAANQGALKHLDLRGG